MITTMVIDDNRIIREHFRKRVDWEALGFELVSVVSNGALGWEEFCKYRPQLVITDIQMPGMSGIELAKKVKEAFHDTVIVFTSRDEDLKYMRAAIDMGVDEYILKDEIGDSKFYEKLGKLRGKAELYNEYRKNYCESKLHLALSSTDMSKVEKIFPYTYTLLILEQKSFLPPFADFLDGDIVEIEEGRMLSFCYSFSNEILSVVRIKKYRYVILIRSCEKIETLISKLVNALNDNMNMPFYSLKAGQNQSIRECIYLYRQTVDQMQYKYFSKHGQIIKPSVVPDRSRTEEISKIFDAAKESDTEKMCKILDSFYNAIHANQDYALLIELVTEILYFLREERKNTNDGILMELSICSEEDYEFLSYAGEICFWIKNKMLQYVRLLRKNPVFGYSPTVRKALSYIQNNYQNKELSVGDIADYVGMNPNHLNKMMKQETGATAIKWLTKTRMDIAKQMLERQYKISDIFEQVGYANISYFSNVFKKAVGVTPLEYRKRKNDRRIPIPYLYFKNTV